MPSSAPTTAQAPGPNKTPEGEEARRPTPVLRRIDASKARPAVKAAYRFLALTAARSGEVRLATWDEIDGHTWTIPAERTKTGKQHRVALSGAAVAVLDGLGRRAPGRLIFTATPISGPLGTSTLNMLAERLGIDASAHGLRSSFRSWCQDSGQPREAAEAALGHVVRGVEGAYARSDLLERRRAVMEAWATYLEAA